MNAIHKTRENGERQKNRNTKRERQRKKDKERQKDNQKTKKEKEGVCMCVCICLCLFDTCENSTFCSSLFKFVFLKEDSPPETNSSLSMSEP